MPKEFSSIKNRLLILILLCLSFQSNAQFSADDIKQGHKQVGDSLYFVFSESLYGLNSIKNVSVTGSFRNWDQNMDNRIWMLQNVGNGIWQVGINNKEFEKVKPGSSFKFRVNDGKWLDPPTGATNTDGGNLVFMKGVQPLSLEAGIESNTSIDVWVMGLPKGHNAVTRLVDFVLTDSKGKKIPLKTITNFVAEKSENGNQIHHHFSITPVGTIDKRRVYYLTHTKLKLKTLLSFEPWFAKLKSDKELGANISPDGKITYFRIFSPRATKVNLYLYKSKNDKKPYEVLGMKVDANGVWEAKILSDLEGTWYDFTVHGFKEPGNSFFESHPVHISDPYARVSDDSFGKCMVAKKTIPASPVKGGRPAMEQVMAYEVHVQDFTDLLPVPEEMKGTLPAMHKSGLKNTRGEAIGFDYLKTLGINTVHLMPVQEMLHWPKDEWEKAFANDPYMIEQGVAKENYDWGYRTSHSFAIETRYRQKNTKEGAEREQFRDLVQSFHNEGMSVIVDFVFNHTAENMDGRDYLFHFNALDKQYYYRTKNLEHIGAYGNETKSENRYMVQRWITDQCKHFIEEFGIDGFRIDLAGQTDQQTLLALKAALPKDIIIYGEPWIDSNDPAYNNNPDWHWYKEDAPICYFNDDTRNTYKGPVFELKDPAKDRGWAGGNFELINDVKKGLSCGFPTQKNINSAINYLDIHDNFALSDQFALTNWDGRFGVDEGAYKIAAALLFTTPGPLVLHGGSEFMRSKGLAPLEEIVKEIPSGKLYFHGKRDTYNVRTANQFIWDNIGKGNSKDPVKPYGNSDFKGMKDFWTNMMNFRKEVLFQLPSFQVSDKKPNIQFFNFSNPAQLAYMIDEKVLVIINADSKANLFSGLPMDKGWKLKISTNKEILGDLNKLVMNSTGVAPALEAKSLMIFVKE
jgi:pullulanase/glycogen debranching enzyme